MRPWVIALLFGLPLLASAQAIRCKDPATGRTVYTDQPCKGGEVVVPARTEAERAADELAAEQARARAADRQQQMQFEQRMRLENARQEAAAAAAVPPSQTPQCQRAMADADFQARSNTASSEQIRTARYNAALACGQQPPGDVVVVQPEPWGVVRPHRPPHGYPGGWGPSGGYPPPVEPQRPRPPTYGGGTLDNRPIPVAPARPPAAQTRPTPSSSGIAVPRGSGTVRWDE